MAQKYTTDAIMALSEAEKLRFALAYLNHNDPKNVDWAAAAAQSGSKSKESFRVMFNQTLKKLQKASEGATGVDASAPMPASNPKTPNKRKKTVPDDGDDEEVPSTKKRGRKKAVRKEATPKEQEPEPEPEPTVKAEAKAEDDVEDFNQLVEESFFDTPEAL